MGQEDTRHVPDYKAENYNEREGGSTALMSGRAVDLEAQRKEVIGHSAAEYHIPASTKYLYLCLYFALNLSLTIYNKALLDKVSTTPRASKVCASYRLDNLSDCQVRISLAAYDRSHRHSFDRVLRATIKGSIWVD